MESLITPAFLTKGDRIGVIAPARSVSAGEIEPFCKLLQKRGFEVIQGDHLFGSSNQYSGSVAERTVDLLKMIRDPAIKAIFAARGGYGSAQLLKGMDWEAIRENPKWIVGFSDITAIHSAWGKYMETLHAVMPYSLSMKEPQSEESIERTLDALMGGDISYQVENHPLNQQGFSEGRLVGGNLSVLYSLAGTPYEPEYEGALLFLEDLDEYLYHIDRMLLNFEIRGVFHKVSGLVVGDFSDIHDNDVPFGSQALEIIAEKAVKYKLPALFGFPAGHKKNNFPQIFGRFSTLTVKEEGNNLLQHEP